MLGHEWGNPCSQWKRGASLADGRLWRGRASMPNWNPAIHILAFLSKSLEKLGYGFGSKCYFPLILLEAWLEVLHVRGSVESVFNEVKASPTLFKVVCTYETLIRIYLLLIERHSSSQHLRGDATPLCFANHRDMVRRKRSMQANGIARAATLVFSLGIWVGGSETPCSCNGNQRFRMPWYTSVNLEAYYHSPRIDLHSCLYEPLPVSYWFLLWWAVSNVYEPCCGYTSSNNIFTRILSLASAQCESRKSIGLTPSRIENVKWPLAQSFLESRVIELSGGLQVTYVHLITVFSGFLAHC